MSTATVQGSRESPAELLAAVACDGGSHILADLKWEAGAEVEAGAVSQGLLSEASITSADPK